MNVAPEKIESYSVIDFGERLMIRFTQDQISALHTGVVCEMWNRFSGRYRNEWTGSARRKYLAEFTPAERKRASHIFNRYIWPWNMTKGIPHRGCLMSIHTYQFIQRLVQFSASL